MGKEIVQGKNQLNVTKYSRRSDVEYIDSKFDVTSTIKKIHHMMEEVTKKEINAITVNAACNCISKLNETINTTINAARFLKEMNTNEEG